VLPHHIFAGNLVGRALASCTGSPSFPEIVFLISSLVYRVTDGTAHVFAARHVPASADVRRCTLISQFGIIPRMDVLRASLGDVRAAPVDKS